MGFAARADNRPFMLSWFHLLDRASSVPEVVNVCREYLATWHPEELALLPKASRPGRIKGAADLEELHGCLVEEYRRNRASGEELAALQRMTSFVVRASVRLAQLRADEAESREDNAQAPREGTPARRGSRS